MNSHDGADVAGVVNGLDGVARHPTAGHRMPGVRQAAARYKDKQNNFKQEKTHRSLDCLRMFSNKMKNNTIWIHIWQKNWKKDSPDSALPINVSMMTEPKATRIGSLLLAMPLR